MTGKMAPSRMLRMYDHIVKAAYRGDLAAEQRANHAFDRAFPGAGRPVAIKPSKRGRRA